MIHAFAAHSYASPLATAGMLSRPLRRPDDLAIDPVPRSRSARFLLGLVKARHRIGYEWGIGWRDAVLTRRIAAERACGAIRIERILEGRGAVGARVLGLFKVTDAAKYAPYGNGSLVAQATDVTPMPRPSRIRSWTSSVPGRRPGGSARVRGPHGRIRIPA
ncbi:MAG: hypothetical protein IT481_06030 [Gammaproteobacteria bacterium]|nr:hypothetical protein [Gammaproteobacteria bacterium]